MIRNQRYTQTILSLAKKFRKQATPAEAIFWDLVKSNRSRGLHFRRQQIIDGFIADFYCDKIKLVFEIDGGIHETQRDYDKERERVIRTHDIRIIRFSNNEVLYTVAAVIQKLESMT
jgi:very-short-patch-repair endonuclease